MFKVGDIVKTRDGREAVILSAQGPAWYPLVGYIRGMLTPVPEMWTENGQRRESRESPEDLIPPKRTREVTIYVNVLKHEGFEWNTTHDSYAVAKYSTTILDPRIEVLAVAVPVTFTIEY